MPKPAQSDDVLYVELDRDEYILIPRTLDIDESHCMGYEPCLSLECSKCGLTVKHNSAELKQWCTEDLT